MTHPIKAALFDKDGTLFDFAATWNAWAKATLLDLTNGDAVRAKTVGALGIWANIQWRLPLYSKR